MTHLVAVYGSLRRGFSNHTLIEGSLFIGEDWLLSYGDFWCAGRWEDGVSC